MAEPMPEPTALKGAARAAKTGALAALYFASAAFVAGTLIAVIGKPIWLWVNWLWNLYP